MNTRAVIAVLFVLGVLGVLPALMHAQPARETRPASDARVALVIGNAAYTPPADLRNPVNDAKAVAGVLRRLGFEVVEVPDAGRLAMRTALHQLQSLTKGKRGVSLVYYAGHGLQQEWRNYMVPVDARVSMPQHIAERTVDVSDVLAAFKEAGNRLNILVLDACRTNIFDNTLSTKGLAPLDAPPGTFVAFSTTPGNEASDDEKEDNSLYTRFLVEGLGRPEARLEDVFKRVKVRVRERTGGAQVPAESSSVDEEFSFDRGFLRPETNNERRLERYKAERSEWDRVKQSQNASDFFAFLLRYPNGFMSEIAQFQADRLQKVAVIPQQLPDRVAALSSGVNRFAVGDAYTLVTTDRMTGQIRRERHEVTFADNDRVAINGGAWLYDQMGGVLRDDSGDKDPALMLVPADIATGKKWRSVFQNQYGPHRVTAVVDFKAGALEDVSLGSERAQAYRVQFNGFASDFRGSVHITGELWIEPGTMRMVRWDRQVRFGGGLVDSMSMVVNNYRRAPR